jgi:hypothetical protein
MRLRVRKIKARGRRSLSLSLGVQKITARNLLIRDKTR